MALTLQVKNLKRSRLRGTTVLISIVKTYLVLDLKPFLRILSHIKNISIIYKTFHGWVKMFKSTLNQLASLLKEMWTCDALQSRLVPLTNTTLPCTAAGIIKRHFTA